MAIRRIQSKTKGTRFAVRVHKGGGRYEMIGTFPTKAAAKEAEAKHLLAKRTGSRRMTGNEWADFYLESYRERVKPSSYKSAAGCLAVWRREFGTRTLASIEPTEAEEWARQHRSATGPVISMLNYAVKKEVLGRNPFAGLTRKSNGRKANVPLTVDEVDAMVASARRHVSENFAAFITFAAYSGLRVGEIFALEWADIDFKANRIHVRRRLYEGELDLPKSNKKTVVVLLPEARDALLSLDKGSGWIFEGKTGGHMTQGKLWTYWQSAAAVLDRKVTPHELRHFCAHHLYVTRGMPARVVAVQLSHADESLVLNTYGHGDHGALEEIDRLYETRDNVVPIDQKRRSA